MASFFGGGNTFGSSIDSSEITDGSIVDADVNASAAIAFSKLSGVQASDATLTSIAALGTASDKVAYTTGVDTWAETALTSYGRSLIDDVDASTARSTLGLGTIATQASDNVSITGGSITGITDLTVADGGTGLSSTTAYAVLCGGTTGTAALQSIASVGTSGHVLTSNGAGALPTFQAPAAGGTFVKQVRATTTTAGSTATAIPFDDTIPQNTEGAEVLTCAITPANSSNILVIEYRLHGSMTTGNVNVPKHCTSALFQDTTADALYSQVDGSLGRSDSASNLILGFNVYGKYYMTAGTTSETTFKLRVGANDGVVTYYWLSHLGTGLFSTTNPATITITEYSA